MVEANPWKEFSIRHRLYEQLLLHIKEITDFGLIVALEGGIEGIVHLSDISWTEAGENAISHFSKGDHVEAVILSIDVERERVALGIKQCRMNPWQQFAKTYRRGDRLVAAILGISSKIIIVALPGGIRGMIDGYDPDDIPPRLIPGGEVEVEVLDIQVKHQRILLALTKPGRGAGSPVPSPGSGPLPSIANSKPMEDEIQGSRKGKF